MSAIGNIYLIIFLPLFSSLLCQIFSKKSLPFSIALSSLILVFFLILKVLPDVLIYEKISKDFELAPLSIALEFKLDVLGIIFLLLVTFLKIVILFYYRFDIESFLDQRGRKIFYSVYLLHLFALVGIFTSNNLLNLFFFFEIYAFGFFAISSISKNLKISKLSFRYFCLNSASSLIILFCFLAIYLTFGEINFNYINEIFALNANSNSWFSAIICLLLLLAFVVKFFPFWLYFENLKSINLITNFIAVDSLFIKTNVGIFIVLKFLYFFFGSHLIFDQFDLAPFLIFISLLIIFYSAIKLHGQKHLKTIAAYLCLNNLGFILACLALQSFESLQALFFYLLNFSLVNLLIFIFATFLKRNFKTSSINKIWLVKQNSYLLALPIKLLIVFIAAFPLSILFFANWYLAYASFSLDFSAFLLVGLVVSNFVHISLANKIIVAFSKNDAKSDWQKTKLSAKQYGFYLASFWFLITTIYFLSLTSGLANSLSLRLASFLLSNSI
ncbi:MAG: hypothetical protein EBS06_00630 [Proteobacteria bacterium]|nr:hypothetical protein [Pseudomonadota bacterium]